METALCLPNITSHSITEKPFWESGIKIPEFQSKASFKKWVATPTTQHCVFSLIEGLDPNQRVKKDANPPRRLRGFVADYDAKFTEAEVKDFVRRSLESDYPISYFGRSYSGGIHAIWLFETPVLVDGAAPSMAFLKRFAKEVHASSLARGLDPKFNDPTMYYTVGGVWNKVSEQRVDRQMAYYWQYETSRAKDFEGYGVELPLDEVYTEVVKRWPGKWKGPFTEGSRGARFWIEGADNDTAAVIRPSGVQCFTGDQPFVAWAEILGPAFVNKFTADRVGEAIANFYYDGNSFWHDRDDGVYPLARSDIILSLKVDHGFLSKVRKGERHSELDQAMADIISSKRVESALPFVFDKRRLIRVNGREYLNTSLLEPMKAANKKQKWKEDFPEFGRFLEGMFGKKQLPYMLSWLSRYYKDAVEGRPRAGQALFILGDPDSGKTLLNTRYLSAIYGGHQRAADFLLHRNSFNGSLFEVGLWALDDEVGEVDKAKFSGRLKEFVANFDFFYSEKFRKGGLVMWKGRVVSTLNCDYESIRLLPDLDMNIVDKLMIFNVQKIDDLDFTPEWIEGVDAELPYFCRYLLDYKIPKSVKGSSRFGIISYIDPTVRNMTLVDNRQSYLLEIIAMFEDIYSFDDDETFWEGSASQFVKVLSGVSGAAQLFKNTNPQMIGRGFSHLASKGHPKISRAPVDKSGVQKWRIHKVAQS
jgi:hypothetical protein